MIVFENIPTRAEKQILEELAFPVCVQPCLMIQPPEGKLHNPCRLTFEVGQVDGDQELTGFEKTFLFYIVF